MSDAAPPPASVVRAPLAQRLLGGLGALLVRLLVLTLRIRIVDRAGLGARAPDSPVIWLFWHNRILIFPHLWTRYFGHRKAGAAMTSTSKDGEWIAQLVSRFGFHPIRGSTSRRSLGALREIIGFLRAGGDVGITPDGSRGPKYELKPGVVAAAQLARCPVLPVGVEYSRYVTLKSWDAFRIPLPFSRVDFTLAELVEVPRTKDDAAFETERVRLEKALMAVTTTP